MATCRTPPPPSSSSPGMSPTTPSMYTASDQSTSAGSSSGSGAESDFDEDDSCMGSSGVVTRGRARHTRHHQHRHHHHHHHNHHHPRHNVTGASTSRRNNTTPSEQGHLLDGHRLNQNSSSGGHGDDGLDIAHMNDAGDLSVDPSSSHRHVDELLSFPSRAYDKAEEIARRVWDAGWTVVHHQHLPKWLRDNDFLIKGHRPPLHSFYACFKSIFRIHTETGNIWTHLLGFIAFLGVATYFLTRPSEDIQWQEKAVFSAFFAGAILCMGFSTMFHTVFCHSERVGKLFNKLDYCGIALLTMGSFVPWLYYSFYCRLSPKIVYLVLILILGTICIIVSMWDKFATPKFRAVRAGVFIALGLSGVVPAMHYVITDGFYEAVNFAALGWLVLMAFLYITGAVIYAVRIPERIWPGKFDIWFSSHQIFHIFVIAAAFVHFHGISKIANYRLSFGDCLEES